MKRKIMYKLFEYHKNGVFDAYAISKGTSYRYNFVDTLSECLLALEEDRGICFSENEYEKHIFVCDFNSIEELKETHPEVFI